MAAVMATNSADQFRPWRLHRRTSSPSLCATMRNPSCFSSWIQPSPTGTFAESTGRHGRMKPGGLRRSRARGERINIGADLARQCSFCHCSGVAQRSEAGGSL